MSWAEQTWNRVADRILAKRLLREIGAVAFEVFHFLVYRSIQGGEGTGLLDPTESGTLHVLYDAVMIGDALQLKEEDIREAIDLLAEFEWIRIRGNNGNSILIIGDLCCHSAKDGTPLLEGIKLVFDQRYPRPRDAWAEQAFKRILARKEAGG